MWEQNGATALQPKHAHLLLRQVQAGCIPEAQTGSTTGGGAEGAEGSTTATPGIVPVEQSGRWILGGRIMRKISENQNGNVWHDADINVSVFEDVQGDTPRYYAWRGTWPWR